MVPRKSLFYPIYLHFQLSYDMAAALRRVLAITPLQDWRRLHAVILAERKFQSILPTLSCNLIAAPFELQDCERIFSFRCHDGRPNKSSCCDLISQCYIRNFRAVTTLIFACLAHVKLISIWTPSQYEIYQQVYELPVTPVLPSQAFSHMEVDPISFPQPSEAESGRFIRRIGRSKHASENFVCWDVYSS